MLAVKKKKKSLVYVKSKMYKILFFFYKTIKQTSYNPYPYVATHIVNQLIKLTSLISLHLEKDYSRIVDGNSKEPAAMWKIDFKSVMVFARVFVPMMIKKKKKGSNHAAVGTCLGLSLNIVFEMLLSYSYWRKCCLVFYQIRFKML